MKLTDFYLAPTIADAYHLEHTVNDQHGDIHCTTISERARIGADGRLDQRPAAAADLLYGLPA